MNTNQESEFRSTDMNAYYWGIVVKFIAAFKGWQNHVAHDWVKVTWGIDSTADLSPNEFSTLMAQIRTHTTKFWKFNIPLPNEDLETLGKRMSAEELYYHFNPRLK